MSELIRSEIWALEALEKIGKESRGMSEPRDVREVWVSCEIRLFPHELPNRRIKKRFTMSGPNLNEDYGSGLDWDSAQKHFFAENDDNIRPLPAAPEWVSEEQIAELHRLVGNAYREDDWARGSYDPSATKDKIDAWLKSIRAAQPADQEDGR